MAKALYIRSFKAFALTGVLDNFKRTGRYFSRLSANSWNRDADFVKPRDFF